MTNSADELHRRAVDLVNRGRFSAARRALASARARAVDADLGARIEGTAAYITARTGDVPRAEQMCRDALAIPGLTPHTVAILAGQLGTLAHEGGRLADADRWLARAIAGLGDDPVAEANMRVNRSLVSMDRRLLAQAEDDLARAADIFTAHAMPIAAAQARHNLGYVAMLAGDLVEALTLMVSARALASESEVGRAIGDLDRADVLREAGLASEAEQILVQVAATFGANRMRRDRALAELTLARSLLTHDPAGAVDAATAASRRFGALGNDAWRARAEGVRLRGIEMGGVRRAPTQPEIDQAADDLARLRLRSDAAGLRLAHELRRAREGAPSGGGIRVPPSATLDVKLLAHEVRAARAAAAGQHAASRRHAAAGLEELSSWRAAFGSLDLQTSLGAHGAGLMFAGLTAAVASGRPDVVFEWSERARHLSQQVIPLRPPPDPELASELAELRMLRAEAGSEDWLGDPRARSLRERVRQRQWSATGSAARESQIGIDAFRAALDADTAHIAYVFSGRSLQALVVTRESSRLVALADWGSVQRLLAGLRADLDMSAGHRSGPFAAVIAQSLADRLSALSSALLGAPARAAGDRRLVITVPGVLNSIPWSMLPAMAGRAFTLAVSATRWARLRAAPVAQPETAGFVMGPRVARAAEEVAVAAGSWRAPTTLAVDDASVGAVTALASEVDVLHVASHGRHAVDNPLFSGLELADGTLFGYDIDLIPQVPRTVVLSACEVGRSSVRWGEEAVGMTRIWLHAGTRCVIASPVVVADDDACVLLGAMHEGLARGVAPAEALAAASARTGVTAPFQAHGTGF